MKILFLHGWKSIVGGVKPTYLRNQAHEVINPKLDDDDFDAALETAQSYFDEHQPDVVVGSSRGGAVALNLRSDNTPLVLLCPAWKRWGKVKRLKPNSIILHSREDEVIPFAESEELIELSRLSTAHLLEVGSDHRLADPQSLAAMNWACEMVTSSEPKPWDGEDRPTQSLGSDAGESVDSQSDATYICDGCGEEIVVPLDVTEGENQSYVEDCPVCCRANIIHVQFDSAGNASVWAEPEQDREN